MNASTNRQRSYGISDLETLMSRVGDWATGWDDVLHYLDGAAERHPDFSAQQTADLSEDMRALRRDNVPFTRNYREIWNQLDGSVTVPERKSASSRVADVMHRLESKEYQEMAAELARSRDSRWKS